MDYLNFQQSSNGLGHKKKSQGTASRPFARQSNVLAIVSVDSASVASVEQLASRVKPLMHVCFTSWT
jgi:hypothetical protein